VDDLKGGLPVTNLTILDRVPDGLLDAGARDLGEVLDGPTLIELGDGDRAPLFMSVLLHGNEDSGLGAIQRVLRTYADKPLPRPLMILIGNVAAASKGLRRLDGQPDFNRVWPGCEEDGDSDEARIMAEVHRRVIARRAFAAIDIHNNTGRNPHYAVVCVREPEVMALAARFAPRAVLFRGLPGTQTSSFSGLISAITIECGQPGCEANAAAAADLVHNVLVLDDLAAMPGDAHLALFHTLARVRVKPRIALARGADDPWLALDPELDRHNFSHVEPGFRFGATNDPMPVEVVDEQGQDVAHDYFVVEDGELRVRQDVIPAMLTVDERIIRQDCLCYIMEELP
jgi:hypothetical protein